MDTETLTPEPGIAKFHIHQQVTSIASRRREGSDLGALGYFLQRWSRRRRRSLPTGWAPLPVGGLVMHSEHPCDRTNGDRP